MPVPGTERKPVWHCGNTTVRNPSDRFRAITEKQWGRAVKRLDWEVTSRRYAQQRGKTLGNAPEDKPKRSGYASVQHEGRWECGKACTQGFRSATGNATHQ